MLSSPDVARVEGILYFRNFKSLEDGRFRRHHILVLGIDHSRVLQYPVEFERTDVDPNLDGSCGWDTNPCSNVYRRLQYYNYIAMAVIAHPHESHSWWIGNGWSEGEVLDDDNKYTGLEIFNSSNAGDRGMAFCCDWWDEVLKKNRAIWGFAGDDCHNVEGNRKSFNRGWIMVNSARPFEDSLEMEGDIMGNIRAGNFYTVVREPDGGGLTPTDGSPSSGPQLSIQDYGDTISVTTDQPSTVTFYICSDADDTRDAIIKDERAGVTHAIRKAEFQEKYVRIVVDQDRRSTVIEGGQPAGEVVEHFRAFSQPLFRVRYRVD